MPGYAVRFRPQARDDLFALYDRIATETGEAVAIGYIDRIEAACLSLATFPQRGTRRDDLGRGVKTIGFEGRILIVFRVSRSVVPIIHIFHGGRDHARLLQAGVRSP